jgi:hypothetical protein
MVGELAVRARGATPGARVTYGVSDEGVDWIAYPYFERGPTRSYQRFADGQTDWGFCHKYGFEPNDRQSYPPFDEKLRTKQACINTVYC